MKQESFWEKVMMDMILVAGALGAIPILYNIQPRFSWTGITIGAIIAGFVISFLKHSRD